MTLRDRVRRTIVRHNLARRETRLVIAISGGSDSVALAYLLKDLAEDGLLAVAGLAHFNHQLRPEAGEDEQFCRDVATVLGWPIVVDREDVAALARTKGVSLESAGRTARHGFLERARLELSADRVALGHTRDDQAETFLLRLARGAGSRGLAAMHPRRGVVIRPLLDCRRGELRAYLTEHHVRWREDLTNRDVTIPRNRVRAELLPVLESRFNPAIVDALADAADIARDEWRLVEELSAQALAAIGRRDAAGWRLDADRLNALPVAVARALLRRVMDEVSGGKPQTFRHIEEVRRLSLEGTGPVDFPAHVVQRLGTDVVLSSRSDRGRSRPGEAANLFRYSLSIPGEVVVPEAGRVVAAFVAPSLEAAERALTRNGVRADVGAIVQLDCSGGLAVRNRRPGDRFRPIGLGGRKKLQDVFVDRKVPKTARDHVPIVVDGADRIVWVAGHGIAAEFRVTDPAQPVLVLTLTELGGRG